MNTNGSHPSRDEYRAKLLGTHAPKTKKLPLFGMEIELRQPSLKDIMAMRDMDDVAVRSAHMIVKYCVVPGTNERIFEEGDVPVIIGWPFGEDMATLNKAITELTGIDISEEKKEIEANPTHAGSSSSAES